MEGGDPMPNPSTEEDIRSHLIARHMDLAKALYFEGTEPEWELEEAEKLADETMQLIHHYATKRELEAFQYGVKVGQYQAADKLYGDVCHIYMFGDNKDSAKAKSISGWSAVGLLKDCEAFMNDNRKAYKEYLAQLKAQKEQENSNGI